MLYLKFQLCHMKYFQRTHIIKSIVSNCRKIPLFVLPIQYCLIFINWVDIVRIPPIYCMNLKHNMDITFTKIRIIQIISIFSKKCLNLFNSQAFFTITIIFPQIIMFCNIFLF